jgi:hypothetical protein
MGSALSSSYLLFAIAFVAGIAVGWLLATVRVKATIRASALPARTSSGAGTRSLAPAKARTMELKCACGSLLKFRDPVEPGYQPYPSGDSVVCPNCGKIKDLSEIRKMLEKDAHV